MDESLVIRPRPSGIRLSLLKIKLTSPLIVVCLLLLTAGLVRYPVSRPSILSAILLVSFMLITLGRLALYYRNVSFAVAGGQLIRTNLLGRKQSVVTAAVKEFVHVRVGIKYSEAFVEQTLVLRDGGRCLFTIGRSDEYSTSDLANLAKATGAPLIDAGTMDAPEFARRFRRSLSRSGLVVIAISSRPRLLQIIGVLLTLSAVAIYAGTQLNWR